MAGTKITKKEAVRRSLARLGEDAMPADIQKDIRERFEIEMGTGHISTTKGELRREAAQKVATPGATEEPATDAKRALVQMEDILALRGLLDRVGADRLKTLIDVMVR